MATWIHHRHDKASAESDAMADGGSSSGDGGSDAHQRCAGCSGKHTTADGSMHRTGADDFYCLGMLGKRKGSKHNNSKTKETSETGHQEK